MLLIFDPVTDELTRASNENLRLRSAFLAALPSAFDTDFTTFEQAVAQAEPAMPQAALELPHASWLANRKPKLRGPALYASERKRLGYAPEEGMTGKDAVLTPFGMVDFLSGIMYGTRLIDNTTELDTCVAIIKDDFVVQGYIMVNKTAELDIFSGLFALYDMAWHIDPLFKACMESPNTMP